MAVPKLKKVAKQRNSRNFRKVLDLWCIRSIEISDYAVNDYQHSETGCLERHDGEDEGGNEVIFKKKILGRRGDLFQ